MFFKLITFFMVIIAPVWAEIQECASMREILQERSPNTLFIFDIDNTILRPSQAIGSDEWVEHSIKKKRLEGAGDADIERDVFDVLVAIYMLTRVRLVEKDTPLVINTLQKENYPLIVLTSRPNHVAIATAHQLKTLDIDIKKSAPIKTKIFLQILPKPIVFEDGIIYTWTQCKGKALLQFLKNLPLLPKKIVVIDDKQHHLEDIEKELFREYANTISFKGLRYSGADAIVKGYDENIASKELEIFMNSLISDEEAKAQIIKKQVA